MKKTIKVICSIALTCFLLSGCSSTKKVSVAEAVNIALEGANGYASASASIDDAVLTKQLTAAGLTEAEAKELRNSMLLRFSDGTGVKVSNGDDVSVSISHDTELAKKFKIELTNTSKTIKASGLVNAQPYDPFQSVEMRCYFWDRMGEIIPTEIKSDPYLKAVKFTFPNLINSQNGDIANCILEYDEEYLLKEGKFIENKSKSFLVDGLVPVNDYLEQNPEYDRNNVDYTKISYIVLQEHKAK